MKEQNKLEKLEGGVANVEIPHQAHAIEAVNTFIRNNFDFGNSKGLKPMKKELKEKYRNLKDTGIAKISVLNFLRDKTIELLEKQEFNEQTVTIQNIAKIAGVDLETDKGYVESFRNNPDSKKEDIWQAYNKIIFD